MNIKKRLFYSNLLMVVLPLITITILFSVLGTIARNIYFSIVGVYTMETEQDSFIKVQSAIEHEDIFMLKDSQEEIQILAEVCQTFGYKLYLASEQNVLFHNMETWELKGVQDYLTENSMFPADQPFWIRQGGWSIFYKKSILGENEVIVVALRDESWPAEEIGADPVITWVTSFVIIAFISVASVILTSLFLTKHMVRKIVMPLNLLYEGAVRIQKGNLEEEIHYSGTDELGRVCSSFNEMQHQLKINIEKNKQYERSRNEMLAGISHDLRTPLTSIKSYVKGILDGVARTPEKQIEYLTVIYRKSSDMERLIDQLFLFSKLETGDFPFRFRKVLIQNYICTWLDTIEPDMKKRNTSILFESSCEREQVLLDSDQMNRVLMNIVENSVKYNAGKWLRITVSLDCIGCDIKLRIKDNGVGVSDGQLERMFDSFYRGDEARSNPSTGSGLGLSIARNIVTAHGGSIYAAVSDGLEIIITLPLEHEEGERIYEASIDYRG